MYKILLVDDEKSILELVRSCLESEGYMIITAETGQMALKWVKEMKPDLVITDLGLPDIDGTEVCASIKKNPKTHGIPVIILTGNTTNEVKIKSNINAQADLFLNKPINTDDLTKAVAIILAKAEKKKLLMRNSFNWNKPAA